MLHTKFNGYFAGQRRLFLDTGGDDTKIQAAPKADTTPVVNAGNEAATTMRGYADQVQSQGDANFQRATAVATPVADAQLGIMRQSQEHGADYFNYMKENGRPLEVAAAKEALAAGSPEAQEIAAGTAMADARKGLTEADNRFFRQGLRYGFNKDQLKSRGEDSSVAAASTIAGAGNTAREREKNIGFDKKMAAAGLFRYVPAAVSTAQGTALSAGSTALGTTMAPGAQKVGTTTAAADITSRGLGMKQAGLGTALSADTNYASQTNQMNLANAQMKANEQAGWGQLVGTGLTAAATYFSSEELKEDKKPVDGELVTKGLQRIPIEAWKYKEGVADEGEHIGPYAEDVNAEFGEAAAPGGKVLDAATMNGIALLVAKSNADRLDRIEKKLGLERRA